MKKFRKIYLEISNVCNLSCSFCPGTKRAPRVMSQTEFEILLSKIRSYTDYLYFHLMGEPLCHPQLEQFLALADAAGFRVILTTNGTLLKSKTQILQNAPALHKINISLHAFESNNLDIPFEEYLENCFLSAKQLSGKAIVCFRLWNAGGNDRENERIIHFLHRHFPGEWVNERRGIRIADHVYLEHGDKFDWPDLSAQDYGNKTFCYGLRDQLGILCDGTVVPCCLDSDGNIPLGNLFEQSLEEILQTPRVTAIYNGFSQGIATEELCRHCGYAQRFSK